MKYSVEELEKKLGETGKMICLSCGSTDFHICNGEECIWVTDDEDAEPIS